MGKHGEGEGALVRGKCQTNQARRVVGKEGEPVATINDIEVSDFLKACVDFEPTQLHEEFARMSGDYAYWNEKYSAANRLMLMRERDEQKVRARLYLLFKEAPDAGRKLTTEAAVDAKVTLDPAYEEAHLALIEAQAEREHLRGILESLRTKREMLVSEGAHQRQELQGDLRMMERAQTDRAGRRFGGD